MGRSSQSKSSRSRIHRIRRSCTIRSPRRSANTGSTSTRVGRVAVVSAVAVAIALAVAVAAADEEVHIGGQKQPYAVAREIMR